MTNDRCGVLLPASQSDEAGCRGGVEVGEGQNVNGTRIEKQIEKRGR
jgi:hypothetical protein